MYYFANNLTETIAAIFTSDWCYILKIGLELNALRIILTDNVVGE